VDEALPTSLSEPGAVFVTIRRLDGELHGCIGSLEADQPLADAVQRSARLAAFDDPRSRPLLRNELDGVRFEVSVLSPPMSLDVSCELDAVAKLRPHLDGVVLERLQRSATAEALRDANELFGRGKADEAQRRLDEQRRRLQQARDAAPSRAPAERRRGVEDGLSSQEAELGRASSGFGSPASAPAPEAASKTRKQNAAAANDFGL
jgi:hypothetical protein